MKHGWDFVTALTQAIEAWSDGTRRTQPDAFHYRGADLRHAVERAVFFRAINDTDMRRYFDALADRKPIPLASSDPWCAVVASYLTPDGEAPRQGTNSVPVLGWQRRLRSFAGNLSRLGRPSYATQRLNGPVEVLLLAIHPKFVSFMAPVADAIGAGAAYLSSSDPGVEEYLAREKLPSVALRPDYSGSPRSPLLQHFPDLCGFFDRMAAMMDALKPRAILVPEGNAPIYEIANRAGKQRGIATVCLQHGAHGYSNPGFRNWTYSDALVWGSQFMAPFAHHNPQQHFTITGTPASLPAPLRQPDANPIRSIGFFLQRGAVLIPVAESAGLLQFIGQIAKTFPDVEVIIRDHPSSPDLTPFEQAQIGQGPNIKYMPPSRFSLQETLQACDTIVSAASTTLLEAVAVGVIPFIFGTCYPDDYPDIVGAGAAISAETAEAAIKATEKLIRDGNYRENLRINGVKLRPELFAATGQDGARRIAQAVRAAALSQQS
jgi:hypothetical protein